LGAPVSPFVSRSAPHVPLLVRLVRAAALGDAGRASDAADADAGLMLPEWFLLARGGIGDLLFLLLLEGRWFSLFSVMLVL